MKKVLLLAAVALGLSTMGQDAINNRLLKTETPSSAAKEQVEDILFKRGGALDANYDYTDFLYQFYGTDMTLGAITTAPDSSTVIIYSDGTAGNVPNHAVGALYDFNYYGWGGDEFNETDQVTVDSLFVVGGYSIFNGFNTDKIRFTIFKGADGFAAPFSGVQYNAGTFAALDPAAQATMKTMDYAGSASDGNQGGPTATNTVTIDYTLSAADSVGVATIAVEVPNGGLTMNGNELLGIFIEYLPGGATTSDTINYQTSSGDINPFAFYYYGENNTSAPQGYFIQDYDSTSTNCSNFLFSETRYAAYTGTSAWRNDQTSISSLYSHLIWVSASGTSTMTIQDADLSTVSVFPNPSKGVVNIELNATTSAAVTVVDVLGQVIYSANTNFVAGQRQMIDLSNNAKGMYILSIEGEGVNTVERITIK